MTLFRPATGRPGMMVNRAGLKKDLPSVREDARQIFRPE
jgi:hypothetical protein